jgi:hypothetical protein
MLFSTYFEIHFKKKASKYPCKTVKRMALYLRHRKKSTDGGYECTQGFALSE